MKMELLGIINEYGLEIGKMRRDFVHSGGYLHNSAHIWAYSTSKEVLLQIRDMSKNSFPGLYDASAAGQVSYGKSIWRSARDEAKGEIGLNLAQYPVEYLGKVRREIHQDNENFHDREIVNIFLVWLDKNKTHFRFNDGEVSEVVWMPISQFEEEIMDPTKSSAYLPHGQEYYQYIAQEIRRRL